MCFNIFSQYNPWELSSDARTTTIKCRVGDGFKKLFSTSFRGRQFQDLASSQFGCWCRHCDSHFSGISWCLSSGSLIGRERLYYCDELTLTVCADPKCLWKNGLLCILTLEIRTTRIELGERIYLQIILNE